jgi:heme exporter protein C
MWWKYLLFLAMSVIIWFSFTTPAPQQQIGQASRIFYYHIPQAWICVVAFAMAAYYAVKYLRKRNLLDDRLSHDTARLGFTFCVLATITGSVFAKVTWGSFWNWDPRETSILILLLIYGAYFALRSAVEDPERKANLSAVYSIFAFVTVPFLVFIIPRLMLSLHPNESVVTKEGKIAMSGAVGIIFGSSLLAFTVLFLWMFSILKRINRLQMAQETGTN